MVLKAKGVLDYSALCTVAAGGAKPTKASAGRQEAHKAKSFLLGFN